MKRIYGAGLVLLSLSFCILASCINRSSLRPLEDLAVSENFDAQSESVPMPTREPEIQHDTVLMGHVLFMAEDAGQAAQTMALSETAAPDGEEDAVQIVQTQFRPEEPVTRGQAAEYIYAILKDQTAPAESASYTDVPAGSECYAAAQKLAELGILQGYADGTFRPDQPITRGELITALCRAMGEPEVAALAFDDVSAEHWAMGSVAAAMTKGWVSGYDDGQFYPDSPATRAETAVLINKVRGRTPSRLAIDTACETSPYSDVDRRHWAYYDIVDASYTNEFLTYILGEAEGMQPGFMLLGDRLCHVSPVTMRLDYFEKGFHTVTDGLDSDGLYCAEESGYFLRRNPKGLQEFDGSMFYTEAEDGPFMTDFELGYLKFGEDGRYTSGDDELDGLVDAVMSPIIGGKTSSLLNETKLREAYDHLITGGYDYMSRPYAWERGSTKWTKRCAKTMLETKRGACFYWAAAFMYMARRLGYQAYPVCGGVNEYNALHAWVMIDEDDVEYIYDVEMDWAYRTGAHGRVPIRYGRNLFKQRRGASILTYYFPGDTYAPPPRDDEELFDDAPMITWPDAPYGGSAYVEVDGEQVAVEVSWSESVRDDGVRIVTGTIAYNGTTYSMTYTLQDGEGPDAPDTPPDGGGDSGNQPTPTPGQDSGNQNQNQPTPTPGGDSGGQPTPTPGGDSGGEPTPTPGEDSGGEPTPTPGEDSGGEPTTDPDGEDSGDQPTTDPDGEDSDGEGEGPVVPDTPTESEQNTVETDETTVKTDEAAEE